MLKDKGIGERVKKARNNKGMTLTELAAQAKIAVGFLADIESGRANPSIKTLKKLAEALGTTSDYLLFGEIVASPRYNKGVDIELEEFIEKTPGLRLYGEPLDERTKEDIKMALRIIYEQRKREKAKEY